MIKTSNWLGMFPSPTTATTAATTSTHSMSANDNNIRHYMGKRQREGVVREFVSLLHRRVEIPKSSSRAGRRRPHQQQQLSTTTTTTTTTAVQEERLDELVAPQQDGETRIVMTYPALSILPSQEALRWYSEQTLNNSVASFFFLQRQNNSSNAEAADLARRFAVSSLGRPLATTSKREIVQQEFLNVMAQNVAASLVRLVRAEFAKQHPGVCCDKKKRSTMESSTAEKKTASTETKAFSKRIHVESGYLSFIGLPESSQDATANDVENACTIPIYCSMALQVLLLQENDKRIIVPVSLESTGRLTAHFENNESDLISNVHISLDTEDLFESLRRQARSVVMHSLTMDQEDEEEEECNNNDECLMSCNDNDEEEEEEQETCRMPPSPLSSTAKRQKRDSEDEELAGAEDSEL